MQLLRIVLLSLFVGLGVMAAGPSSASAQRVLVYGPGGTPAAGWLPAGATVTVASAAMWASLTTADFGTYDAIWIDSNRCTSDASLFAAARANRAVWSPAVVGRIVVSGGDADFHASGSSGAQQFMRQSAAWIGGLGATSEGGSTGLYVSFGCVSSPPADLLGGFGTFAIASAGCLDPSAVDAHPVTAGLTVASMSMGCFGHQTITGFPTAWQSIVRGGAINQVVVRNDCAAATVPAMGYTVAEGGSVSLAVTTTATLVQWDLDDDGTFEASGNPVTFSAAGRDGPSVQSIAVRTSGDCSSAATSSSIAITNVAPTVTSAAPTTVVAGATLTYTVTATDPAGAGDPRAFRFTSAPTGATIDAASGAISWTPGYASAGTPASFAVEVADGDGGIAVHTFSVAVTCPDLDADGAGDSRCPAQADCNDADATIFPSATELCDTIDQNCDGAVAEGFGIGDSCMVGVGSCTAAGVLACSSPSSAACTAVAGTPGDELCGSLADEDCDGTTDEGFDVGDACTVGVGACAATGARICDVGGLATTCDATEGTAGLETCNAIDDDCNGTVDDGDDALCASSETGTMCLASGLTAACGCASDADCGDATSGRICDLDTATCIDGCNVGADRNGCPEDTFCTSDDPAVDGMCTTTCNFDADCAGSSEMPVCVDGLCGCSDDDDCAADRMCEVASSTCVVRPGVDGGSPDPDGGGIGADAGVRADGSTATTTDGGCGCSVPGADHRRSNGGLLLLALGAMILVRRARRSNPK